MSMDKEKQKNLKKMLESELKNLHEIVKRHKEETLASTELSHYDNHPGDEGSDLYNEELQQALNEKDRQYLEEIKAALTRMEIGTYGKCEVCGKPIAYARLEALPTTTTCIDHADTDEADQTYHSKEGLAVDDVDALAQLEEFGSSDSKAEQSKQTTKDPFDHVSKDSKHV